MAKHFHQFAPPAAAANRAAHIEAACFPRIGAEHAIVALAEGIDLYADHLAGTTEGGCDGFLSPALGTCITGFRQLLNGDIGRLDGGTCDVWVSYVAERVGLDPDAL